MSSSPILTELFISRSFDGESSNPAAVMAGPSQEALERQFQADLERAAALSMETLALEEFK